MADNKQELLKKLKKAALFEETGIIILASTYHTFLEKKKVPHLKNVRKKKISEMLDRLIKDSKRHGKMFRDLIAHLS